MLILAWGIFKQSPWAFSCSLVFLALMTISSITTPWGPTLSSILSGMRFAPTETEFLRGVPVEGIHLAPFVVVPLLVTNGLTLYSKRYLGPDN